MANVFTFPQIFIIKATRLGDLFPKESDVKIIMFSVRNVLFPIWFNKRTQDATDAFPDASSNRYMYNQNCLTFCLAK